MFNNWLQASDISTKIYSPNTWGSNIKFLSKSATKLSPKQCVLIGLDTTAADVVRKVLFSMSWAYPELQLTDLGNVRKNAPDFVIPLLKEVMESQLFPILIGAQPDLFFAQFQAFLNIRDHISLVAIDERPALTLNHKNGQNTHYLNKILHQRRESLFHMSLIGAQAHFTDPNIIEWLDDQNFEYLRLGQARQNSEEVEPILRDADLLSFHLDALKQMEAPGQLNPSPSGFFLEEACQMARYAGMSDKLRSFGIYGFNSNTKRKLFPTAQAVAQLIWYFTEGFYHRKGDYPVTNKGLTEYVVDMKGKDSKLTFWKSPKSDRWWLQLVDKTSRKLERHRLVPCSYEDYVKATQQELPNRLWSAFKRF